MYVASCRPTDYVWFQNGPTVRAPRPPRVLYALLYNALLLSAVCRRGVLRYRHRYCCLLCVGEVFYATGMPVACGEGCGRGWEVGFITPKPKKVWSVAVSLFTSWFQNRPLSPLSSK